VLEPSSICTASCSPIDLHIGPGSRGVHPPWGHDAFSPCSRFLPIFKKISDSVKNFQNVTFSRKFFPFPPCFAKIIISPTLKNFPPVFHKFTCFLHTLCGFRFPPTLTIMHYSSPKARTGRLWCLDLRVLYVDRVFAWHKIYLYNMTSESITLSSEISKIPIEMKLKAHMYRRDSQRISNKTEFRELGTSANQQWRPQRATCT